MSNKKGRLTLQDLITTAKRFGDECVMETAIEQGFSFEQLVALQSGCDAANVERDKARRAKGRFSSYKKPRLSAEARVKKLLGIEDESEGGASGPA